MLPRLQAEERLAEHNVMLAASGNMVPHHRGRYLADLQRRAKGNTRRRAARPTAATLSAMGIAVKASVPSEASDEGINHG